MNYWWMYLVYLVMSTPFCPVPRQIHIFDTETSELANDVLRQAGAGQILGVLAIDTPGEEGTTSVLATASKDRVRGGAGCVPQHRLSPLVDAGGGRWGRRCPMIGVPDDIGQYPWFMVI
jgi:hypothetical protein